jgi:site-specific DNA recombinase
VKVGLYARVSTERQQERGTVGSQLEALRAAAKADGHEVIEEFVDDGYSGARLDRPALDRLRDAAEAGVLDGVLCLDVDRLARAYAYQVLILEEFERFGVKVRFLEGPAPGDDPQATLLIQMQGVIAEYEKAKIAERYRRGKLFRARAGEIIFWKVSYGHRRVVSADGGPARVEIFEPEAEVVREIFHLYVERGLSVRQIAFWLRERGIPSPTGKSIWPTSTIDRLLRNEAYIGTMYYNRHESIPGNGPRGARNRKTRYRERPREEWIAIPVPAIIDRDTFERVKQVTHDNSKWNPRGVEPGVWLLRGLVQCGHCHVACHCQPMRGRNGIHRYYHCPNHDVLRAGSDDRRCPERNIRANELDRYVFEQVRQALLDPQQLIAAERAVIAGAPDENQLVATQLKRLDTAIDANERERARLLDAYQAGLLELDELTRRTATLTARRERLLQEQHALTARSTELATENRLRRGLAGFAKRIAASLDELDFEGRQRLLRLVVEKVRVTGWRVEIHLKIPLVEEPPPDDQGPDDQPPSGEPPSHDPAGPRTEPAEPLSSDMRLRSVGAEDLGMMNEPVDHRGGDDVVAEDLAPAGKGLVRGHDHRRTLIAGGHEREHQVRGLRVERDVADLVTDDQRDPAEGGELVLEPPLALGVLQSGDPLGGGLKPDAVPREARADRDRDRQMRFPGTGRA